MTFLKFFRWLSVILIYPLVFVVIRQTQFFFNSAFFIFAGVVFFAVHVVGVLMLIRTKQREKEMIQPGKTSLGGKNIELCIVAKNEGDHLINVLKHYLSFPESFKICVYDDCSDDGSFEQLMDLASKWQGRLTVKRLERTDKILHPKGMGLESFIKETQAEILLINDADSLIDEADLEKAVSIMASNDYDVVHLSRRNDMNASLATKVSDTEEMNNSALKILGITHYCFPGSGILIKREAAQLVDYSDFIPGDDHEMGRQLQAARKKIYHCQTLFVHEKAPVNFRDFFQQRFKWCRNIAYHLFEQETFGPYIQNLPSAFALFFLFGIFSPFSIIIFLVGFSYGLLGVYTRMIFGGKGFFESLLPATINTLQLWMQAAIFTPWCLLIYPVKRNNLDHKKTKV
ncbi:MAG: glycosyltransferase family 2 protein [Thermotogota bacterium]|nr:glycosyltransferase family 2 protein [Thermotogota bacterium]